jgi:hypothetical protein
MSEEEATLGCDARGFRERKRTTTEKRGTKKGCGFRNGKE